MGKKSFAICDSNEVYAKKLYEYFFVKESESYELFLFTSRSDLDEYVKKRHLSILLIGEEMISLNEKIDNVDNILVLKSSETGQSEGYSTIYKYKTADALLKEVMHYCVETAEVHRKRASNKSLKIIGVYSPIKRCFQTTFSITLGQILARESKAVYLNFESFSGFEAMRKNSCGQDMSDLMFFLGCGSDNFSYRLQSMINQVGDLHFISPSHSYITKLGIKGEEWLLLLESFEKYTDYEYLILDLSENMMGLFDVLRECNIVYTIVADDNVSKAKVLQYEKLLEEADYSDVFNKTKLINIPRFKEIPLEYEMLPFSELARYVKKQAKEDKLI
ncbi:MAG: hypothetical protein MJ123_02345 [Lachnospiraceae bacterium]|nr:hypothetical protein [Lachnospiraceae bacterium]